MKPQMSKGPRVLALGVLVLAVGAGWLLSQDNDSQFDWGQPVPWPVFRAGLFLERSITMLRAKLLPPPLLAFHVAGAYMHSKALYSVTKLGIADELASGPKTAAELAAAKGVKADSLLRMLRALSSLGFFKQVKPGLWANNRASGVLRRDHPSTAAPLVLHWGYESYVGHELAYEAMFEGTDIAWKQKHGGQLYWDWLAEHPEQGQVFDDAMLKFSKMVMPALIEGYDWRRLANKTIVDVGGGVGGALIPILHKEPTLRGAILDLPSVIERARKLWAEQHTDILPRAKLVEGSFFDTIPPGDVFFLKFILHDWNDEACKKILRNIRAAIPADKVSEAKLLIVDTAIDDTRPPTVSQAIMDLQMLAMLDGKERTVEEWKQLLGSTGFELVKVHPLRTIPQLLEARAV